MRPLLPMPQSPSLGETSAIKLITNVAPLLPRPKIPSTQHPDVIQLEHRIRNDMTRPSETSFPPTLVAETLHQTYSKTHQNSDPVRFKPVGNCAICGVTFPSSICGVNFFLLPNECQTLWPYPKWPLHPSSLPTVPLLERIQQNKEPGRIGLCWLLWGHSFKGISPRSTRCLCANTRHCGMLLADQLFHMCHFLEKV